MLVICQQIKVQNRSSSPYVHTLAEIALPFDSLNFVFGIFLGRRPHFIWIPRCRNWSWNQRWQGDNFLKFCQVSEFTNHDNLIAKV